MHVYEGSSIDVSLLHQNLDGAILNGDKIQTELNVVGTNEADNIMTIVDEKNIYSYSLNHKILKKELTLQNAAKVCAFDPVHKQSLVTDTSNN